MKDFFKKLKNAKIKPFYIFWGIIIYWEVILKIFTCDTFFDLGLLFMPIFSLVCALIIQSVCSLVKPERVKLYGGLMLLFALALYATQTVYHRFFNKFLIIFSLTSGGVGQVLEGNISRSTLDAILRATPIVLLFLIPMPLYIAFFSRFADTQYKPKKKGIWIGSAIGIHIITVLVIMLTPKVTDVQSGLYDPSFSVTNFGLLRTEALDVKYNLLGLPQRFALAEEESENAAATLTPPASPDEANVCDIDFAALAESEEDETLNTLNSYFAEKRPTNKNEYTGMYEGYNLIFVVAEGFSPYAIDADLTPTLYKMQNDGFKFTNFYTPIWDVSTSDGEYTACTGLIPKSGVWSFYKSSENYMPYCLGNMFESIGVEETYAYHDNSYTYYRRDLSHPNMGYNFKGLGNGVEKYVENVWPQSDLEMIRGSVPEYIDGEKQFHAYYMTVSGHLHYDTSKNAMAAKNWDLVKDLDCSDMIKAYYACNIELDRAMEALLDALKEAGVADKTVISITPDHYPYGLKQEGIDPYEAWDEMLGHEVDPVFELYKSCFLLYCPGTKNAPTISKPCYSADILPTILNLFGFEYDSRLLMGSDILSDSEGLVILSDHSFITESGKYDAVDEVFTPFVKDVFTEDSADKYVEAMEAKISNIFKVSAKILETDYYRYIFKNDEYVKPE